MTWHRMVDRLALALAGLPMTTSSAAQSPPPDPRFKVDILLIVAHPDDESAVSGYLARAAVTSGDYRGFLETQRDEAGSVDVQFVFGKSHVGGGPAGEVLSGVG